MKLIHLTDLHVTTPGNLLHGLCPNAVVRRAVDSINDAHSDADLCIVTGDLTHNGTEAEYEVAAGILAELKVPLSMTIGNHDERQLAFDALPAVVRQEDGFAQGVVDTPLGAIVLLDTKAEGTHSGDFCAARAEWLTQALADRMDVPIWVFLHHPPMQLGMPAMDRIGMSPEGMDRLAQAIGGHPRVRHLFFGHYHRPVSGTWHGLPFSSHRSMMLQCALDLVGRETVMGIFEEPQYAVILIEPDATLVHYHDFDSGAALISTGAPDA